MHKHLTLFCAILALSTVAFADDTYQVGYAANLNIGDSVVNLSNTGATVANGKSTNLCINTYVFDPEEEEISCCACLVTPDGLNSLSVKNDLINNTLTPAVPNSVVIKLVASEPAADPTGRLTVCNPSTVTNLAHGMLAWETTLAPDATAGTYGVVGHTFQFADLSAAELSVQITTCGFIQTDGSGYGICSSCNIGALAGAKQ
jgi:hypothetical protein